MRLILVMGWRHLLAMLVLAVAAGLWLGEWIHAKHPTLRRNSTKR